MARRESPPSEFVVIPDDVSSAEALAFVHELQNDRTRVAEIIGSTPLAKLQGIARRVLMDLGKGPPHVETKPKAPRRSARKKAPAKRKVRSPRGSGGKRGN